MLRHTLVDSLRAKIGTEIHVGEWHRISQRQVNRFADVTEDRQWIHTDPVRAAAESPFGETVAHGFFLVSLIPHLTESSRAPDHLYPGAKSVVTYGLDRIRFPRAAPVGARVRSRKALRDIRETAHGFDIFYRVTIEIDGFEKPGCVADMITRINF